MFNKKGYTLSEVLITLGIIGIIAAVMLPAANNVKPNPNKMAFLKVYDEISTQVRNFASNSRYFPVCQTVGGANRCFPEYPLFNTTQGIDNILHDIQQNMGQNKLCYLLADSMGVDAANVDTTNGCTFTTQRNISFNINTTRNNNQFLSTVLFDVTGNNGLNNLYNANNVNPTTFRLYITADGNVYPGDFASDSYIRTRKSTKNKNLGNAGNNANFVINIGDNRTVVNFIN
ncbi:prepilin-type N-terminal cleavage/methylation domain-containing protein [bacterium]|nr:prepilin-type N-terminal cleavage/methylation domain-containing protein [bacterium]